MRRTLKTKRTYEWNKTQPDGWKEFAGLSKDADVKTEHIEMTDCSGVVRFKVTKNESLELLYTGVPNSDNSRFYVESVEVYSIMD